MKRVLLADDHAIVRSGLRKLMEEDLGIEVVAEAEDGLQAVELCRKFCPDLVVLDLSMPKMHGLAVIPLIKSQCSRARILVFTMLNGQQQIIEAIMAGADGYVPKDCGIGELLVAIEALKYGKRYLVPQLARYINIHNLESAGHNDDASLNALATLTKREREIMKLVAKGFTNKDIGAMLYISHRTVDKHRSNIMEKLAVHSARELTMLAIRSGMIEARC